MTEFYLCIIDHRNMWVNWTKYQQKICSKWRATILPWIRSKKKRNCEVENYFFIVVITEANGAITRVVIKKISAGFRPLWKKPLQTSFGSRNDVRKKKRGGEWIAEHENQMNDFF